MFPKDYRLPIRRVISAGDLIHSMVTTPNDIVLYA